MHDWWLALVAAAAGRLEICPQALVDYRIHPANPIGIPALRLVSRLIGSRAGGAGVAAGLMAAVRQAQALEPRVSARMARAELDRLQAFIRIAGSGWLRRRWLLLRYGIAKHGPLRQLNLLARC
ncbi:MAG TPA: hypothetical protein VHX44_18180 [Planctomycetota bacterium]|nr:hypothetical protein [Planctomycetota bacterium]